MGSVSLSENHVPSQKAIAAVLTQMETNKIGLFMKIKEKVSYQTLLPSSRL